MSTDDECADCREAAGGDVPRKGEPMSAERRRCRPNTESLLWDGLVFVWDRLR